MTNGSAMSEANLVDITNTNATVTTGWYLQLPGTNERVLSSANVFNSIVYFSTFTPTTATTCGAGGGNANLYAVQMVTGYAAVNWSQPDQPLTSSDASQTRAVPGGIGSGIPSKPVVIITDSGTSVSAFVITATTSQQMTDKKSPPPNSMRRVVYWKEVF